VRTGKEPTVVNFVLYVTSFLKYGYLLLFMTAGSFVNASESENRPFPAFEEEHIRIKDPLVLF
jgi:hypothetical protein